MAAQIAKRVIVVSGMPPKYFHSAELVLSSSLKAWEMDLEREEQLRE